VPHTPHTPELPLRFRSTFRAAARLDDTSATDAVEGQAPLEQDAAAETAVTVEQDGAAETGVTVEQDAAAETAVTVEQDAAAPRFEPAAVEPEPTAAPHVDPHVEPAREPQEPAKRSGPRHRAERLRNRRPSGAAFRRTVALGCASAIMGVSALGAVAAAADGDASNTIAVSANAADRATPTDTIATSDVEAGVDDGPTVTSDLSVAAAPFTGGTQVTVTGEDLDQVGAVLVGGDAATIVAADESTITFEVPAADDTALGTTAPVEFTDAAGQPVDVEVPTAVVAAGTSVVQPLESELTGVPEAEVPMAPRTLSLTYTSDPGIDAQLAYVLAFWSSYNSAEYPVIDGYDCANFASQSLIARGWAMDGGWYLDRATGAMSPTWASSTALRDYLLTRTDRATYLDDGQRSLVKVGDIAQFDWDGSGDRDHTAVVTRV